MERGPKEGSLRGRAKLVERLRPEDALDVTYYVDKQVIPAALRVLAILGITEEILRGEPAPAKQTSLSEFQ